MPLPRLARARKGAAQYLRMRLTRGAALTYGAVLLIAAALFAIVIILQHMHQDALEAAVAQTEDLAGVLAEQTERSMQAVDIVMREVQDLVGSKDVSTVADFKAALAGEQVHQFLRSRTARLPQVDNIALVAADGIRVNYTVGWPVPPIDMSDREYASHFRAEDDSNLFVAAPVISRATNVWTVYLARRVNGPDGRFVGMVLASLPLQVLAGVYASIDLPHNHGFMLLRRDGTILVRHPDQLPHIGQKMPAGSPWYRLVANGGGHYQSPGYFDVSARVVAVQPLKNYPLVVDVGLATDVALMHWRHMAVTIGVGSAAAATTLLLLVFLLRQQLRRLEHSRTVLHQRNSELLRIAGALRESQASLDERSREQATTLAAMDQGLMTVDAQGRIALCNARAIELLDLPKDLMAMRPPFEQVSALHAASRVFAPLAEALQAPLPAGDPSEPAVTPLTHSGEHHLPSGCIIDVRCVPLPGGGVVATFDDVTARRQAEQQVAFMARHDPLTRLPNRAALVERLIQAIAQAERGSSAGVLLLDLDHFKEVNDTLGHPTGDCLLCAVADRLTACVRQVDTVARFGGDEFAVVQADSERAEEVGLLAARIIEILSLPYELDGHQVIVGASVGIALIPADGTDPDTLLKNVDIALYRAKSDGRGVFRFFAPAMDARLQERRQLELDLQYAMTHHEFMLYFQPLVDLAEERVTAFEALLRWQHHGRGLLQPDQFVPLTEEMGLIVPLGAWVLREACREAALWPDGIKVAVNLSPVQFRYRELVPTVARALEESGLPPHRLELEITETALLHNSEEVLTILHALRRLGVVIVMDDFGTGYSSLSYLRSFPFDKIKIDRSFVRDLPHDADAAAIVRAVATLGSSLGIVTTAEGVETGDQLASLRAEGCVEAQGYLYSQPCPAGEVPALLRSLQRRPATAAA